MRSDARRDEWDMVLGAQNLVGRSDELTCLKSAEGQGQGSVVTQLVMEAGSGTDGQERPVVTELALPLEMTSLGKTKVFR